MKALSPARVKEVRIDEELGTAEVIVPDYQLSLAIGKEGQNARLAAGSRAGASRSRARRRSPPRRPTGKVDWAEGEWVLDPDTGEQVWRPAEGGPTVSLDEWTGAAAATPAVADAVADAPVGGAPAGGAPVGGAAGAATDGGSAS